MAADRCADDAAMPSASVRLERILVGMKIAGRLVLEDAEGVSAWLMYWIG